MPPTSPRTAGLLLPLILLVTSQSLAQPRPAQTQPDSPRVDPKRIDEIAAMLSDKRFAFGPAPGDRAAWETLAKKPAFRDIIRRAEEAAAKPIPDLPDDLYLDYARTGDRDRYQAVYFERTGRVMPLVIAEGIEHRGRFVPAIEALVRALCQQRTWVLPAHDGKLQNFRGQAIDIDLFSSAIACSLASAAWLLEDQLSADVKKLIDENVHRRVLDPFADMMLEKRPMNGWLTVKNNWNAVCLCNVTGTALAALPRREDRALYLAAAERYSESYLAGFGNDGYCIEGVGYWNYGFGNYLRLCEMAAQATGGKLNWFDRPKVAAVAAYPGTFQIAEGIYPAFGDTVVGTRPTAAFVAFVNRRFGLAGSDDIEHGFLSTHVGGGLSETLAFSSPNSATARPRATSQSATSLRNWFGDAGILIARPSGPENKLAVAIKAGRNGVSHGHDDLGSFVVVAGSSMLLTDPGREVYTRRTFGPDRYQSKVLNSFGHSVPIVDDVLQGHTRDNKAEVTRREFTDDADTLALNLTSAYPSPDLENLARTFTYDRRGAGLLTIRDEVRFRPGKPHRFGISLITFGQHKLLSPTQLLIWDDRSAAQIELEGGKGEKLTIAAEQIEEDTQTPTKPLRISAVMDVEKEASMRTTIRAVARPD